MEKFVNFFASKSICQNYLDSPSKDVDKRLPFQDFREIAEVYPVFSNGSCTIFILSLLDLRSSIVPNKVEVKFI